MAHRLQQQISSAAKQVWSYTLVWGSCLAISGVLLLVVAGGSLDYLVRFEDRGLRLLLTGSLLAAGAWLGWRFAYKRFILAIKPQSVAAQLERRNPQLRGQLTSSLEFLDQAEDDPTAGSPILRRAVIGQTAIATEDLDFTSILPKRRVVQGLSLALLMIAGIAAFCIWQPKAAQTAAVRLANPFSETTWPRTTNLQWANVVTHVPTGGAFEVEVVDAHERPLPDDVELQIRYRGTDDIEALPMRSVGSAMRFRRESIVRPFEYRAVGGDDTSMEWTALDVIEPPEVSSLALQLHPPQYTNWPVKESTGRIEALTGTYVALQGVSTKKLQAAHVVLSGEQRVPATITEDGFGFSVHIPGVNSAVPNPALSGNATNEQPISAEQAALPVPAATQPYFVVRNSGAYSLELIDVNGYESADQTQYEIRAVTDEQPRVAISEPASDLVATTTGRLPISISAADDLLLRDVELRYTRSDQSEAGDLSIPFYSREELPPREEDWPAWTAPDDTREVQYTWELRDLRLPPGARVTFYAVAGDFSGQSGQSPARRISIVTPEQLQERLAEEQAFVVDELARILETQVAARGKLSEIELQLRDVGNLKADDLDALQSVELTQRNVERMLTDDVGIRGRVQRLLDLIHNNRLDSADMQRRMQGILDTVSQLSREELPVVNSSLTAAVKDAQMESGQEQASSTLSRSVQQAGAGQDRIIQQLESELGKLSQWNNYRRFFRDTSRIRQDQMQLAHDVADMTAAVLGKRPDELTEQEQTDLNRLQSRHDDLARRLETLQGQMQPMIDTLSENDPLAADILSDALALSQQQAIGQQLRDAGNQVQQNRGANAVRSHEQIGELLQEMLDVLANKREHELARLAKKLEQASHDLQNLQQRQAGLRKRMEDAAAIQDPDERKRELQRLADEQRKLQEEAERMARQLQRLQSSSAASSSSRAAGRMSDAADSMAADQQAAQQAMDDAQQDLENAQQQVQDQQEQIQQDLAEELVAKTVDALQGLRDRQFALLEESGRLAQLRASQSLSLTRGQLMSLRNLARDQELLRDETRVQADRLDPVPAFQLALSSAAEQMDLATILLNQQDESAAAQRQQDALRRLDQLLQALQPPSPQPNGNNDQQGQDSNSSQQGAGDGIPRIAQLRLLKVLQEALNLETQDLDAELQRAAQSGTAMTDSQKRRFSALATEQGRLADLILEMSRPEPDDPLQDLQSPQGAGSNN